MRSRRTPGVLEPEMSKMDGIEDFYNGVTEPSAGADDDDQRRGGESRSGSLPIRSAASVNGALLGVPAGEVRA